MQENTACSFCAFFPIPQKWGCKKTFVFLQPLFLLFTIGLLPAGGAERLGGFATAVLLVMRREESVHGELNFAEGFARVVGITTALFLRNTEIIRGNEHLHIAFQLNDRENPDSNRHNLVFAHSGAHILGEILRERTAHTARNGHTAL